MNIFFGFIDTYPKLRLILGTWIVLHDDSTFNCLNCLLERKIVYVYFGFYYYWFKWFGFICLSFIEVLGDYLDIVYRLGSEIN